MVKELVAGQCGTMISMEIADIFSNMSRKTNLDLQLSNPQN